MTGVQALHDRASLRVQFTHVWVRRDGRWQRVITQQTLMTRQSAEAFVMPAQPIGWT